MKSDNAWKLTREMVKRFEAARYICDQRSRYRGTGAKTPWFKLHRGRCNRGSHGREFSTTPGQLSETISAASRAAALDSFPVLTCSEIGAGSSHPIIRGRPCASRPGKFPADGGWWEQCYRMQMSLISHLLSGRHLSRPPPRATSLEPPPDRCHRCSTTARPSRPLFLSFFPRSRPSSHPRLSMNFASPSICPLCDSVSLPEWILYCLAVLEYEIDDLSVRRLIGRNEESRFRMLDDVSVTSGTASIARIYEGNSLFVAPSSACGYSSALDHLNRVIMTRLCETTRRRLVKYHFPLSFFASLIDRVEQVRLELGEARA